MKSLVKIMALAAVLFVLPAVASARDYGTGVGPGTPEKVSTILDNPSNYVGKKIIVEGVIVDVCKARGCWMELSGDKPGQKLKIKVEDGVIVFPLEARGKKAVVAGKLEELKLSREDAERQARHYAEETGKPFDPSKVKAGSFYQIRATGASIP